MVQSRAKCGVAKNSMKQFCRLFKFTQLASFYAADNF